MSTDEWLHYCSVLKWQDVKIMVQAKVYLPNEPNAVVVIRRGMMITSHEGNQAGKVAGVAIHLDSQKPACLILSHLPEKACYQSLPIGWIECVEEENIILNVSYDRVMAAPGWHVVGA